MNATCSWCGSDDYVVDYDADNDIAMCSGPGHPEPRMFEPKAERAARLEAEQAARSRRSSSGGSSVGYGIAKQLGLYDLLPPLLRSDEWAETGVVEHRFALAHPAEYAWMLDRWGHVGQGPRQYSTTSFIGSTLGWLTRAGVVALKMGRGTGFYDYNGDLGTWSLAPADEDAVDLSWHDYAISIDLPGGPMGSPLP